MTERALYRKTLDGFRPFNEPAQEQFDKCKNILRTLLDFANKNGSVTLFPQRPTLTKMIVEGSPMAEAAVTSQGEVRQIDCSTDAHPNTVITIDTEDYPWVSSRKWTPADNGKGGLYFVSHKGGRKITLHREVARARFYEAVDQISRDTLDNRGSNLRVCTTAQNTWNQTSHKRGNAFYKGVHEVKGRFKAMITAGGITFNLGTFDTAVEAALERDAAAIYLHGEFAFLNFPDAGTCAKKPPLPVRRKGGGNDC